MERVVQGGLAALMVGAFVAVPAGAMSWNYGLKFAVERTRPNGDPRSFPSGHASSTFATTVILQEHDGWKLGVPAFAAAAYMAAARATDKQALGRRCCVQGIPGRGKRPHGDRPPAGYTRIAGTLAGSGQRWCAAQCDEVRQ